MINQRVGERCENYQKVIVYRDRYKVGKKQRFLTESSKSSMKIYP